MGTMASSTHQFEVLDLIRAGLQDLGAARTLLDELRADGIDDDRLCLLMKTLEQTCEPDCRCGCCRCRCGCLLRVTAGIAAEAENTCRKQQRKQSEQRVIAIA